jgi:hypothetical protein
VCVFVCVCVCVCVWCVCVCVWFCVFICVSVSLSVCVCRLPCVSLTEFCISCAITMRAWGEFARVFSYCTCVVVSVRVFVGG